ncbi:5'/3'-nucleotidase sure [Panus rudis PR-1116 ss-1]|nr:5'/3'-nucleotidase sure [Panus rudis PR-1116 ss-1]
MHFPLTPFVFVCGILASAMSVSALNILLTNDDSWASANIRATYDALKSDGHDVLLVGPAVQQSGTGSTLVLPTTNIVAPGGEFGTIPVGAPFFGTAADDPHIWYFNGTPVATALFALDVIVPKVWPGKTVDLAVSGPNEGSVTGPFAFTLSGTIGAAYVLIERNIPAVAFSAGNGTHRPFTDNTGKANDPANIAARLTVDFVTALTRKVLSGQRLLPPGIGISLLATFYVLVIQKRQLPHIWTWNKMYEGSRSQPHFKLSRVTKNATVETIAINPATGFPVHASDISHLNGSSTDGINALINGRKKLKGETALSSECKTAVSIFSIDSDAPKKMAEPIQDRLSPIINNI